MPPNTIKIAVIAGEIGQRRLCITATVTASLVSNPCCWLISAAWKYMSSHHAYHLQAKMIDITEPQSKPSLASQNVADAFADVRRFLGTASPADGTGFKRHQPV